MLVDDGKVAVVVEHIDGDDVVCTVTEGGPVSNNKGLSMPGMAFSVPALSEKDIADLEFALKLGVDMVALSFVRSPSDVELVRDVMDRVGRRVPVIAKLEKPEAVANLEAIVAAFDAIMVARSDLGVELPLKRFRWYRSGRPGRPGERQPVIVATQMLESMIENSWPTRAEASDVANAVLDGADAVMLSGETSVGKFPLEAADHGAHHLRGGGGINEPPPLIHVPRSKRGVISYSGTRYRRTPDAKALVAFTSSGTPCAGWPGCTATFRCWRSSPLRRSATRWPDLGVETFIGVQGFHRRHDPPGRPRLPEMNRFQRGDLLIIVGRRSAGHSRLD